jgi:hypothetical protein
MQNTRVAKVLLKPQTQRTTILERKDEMNMRIWPSKPSARYPMLTWPNIVATFVIEMIIVPVDVESPIEEAYAGRNILEGRKRGLRERSIYHLQRNKSCP